MKLPQEGYLPRIFIGESDHHAGKPLDEWIALQAREQGLAGATDLRGLMGVGANRRAIHTFKIEPLCEDLPSVVEVVETGETPDAFLDSMDVHIQAGPVALGKARIRFYQANKK